MSTRQHNTLGSIVSKNTGMGVRTLAATAQSRGLESDYSLKSRSCLVQPLRGLKIGGRKDDTNKTN